MRSGARWRWTAARCKAPSDGIPAFIPLLLRPGEASQFDSHGVLTVKSVFICACSFLPVTCFGIHGLSQTAEQANFLDRFKLTYGRRS